MSNVKIIDLVCPNCSGSSKFQMWTSVNAQINPELIISIVNDDFGKNKCPHCQTVLQFEYPLLYHDMKNKLLVGVGIDYSVAVNDLGIPEGYEYHNLKNMRELRAFIIDNYNKEYIGKIKIIID